MTAAESGERVMKVFTLWAPYAWLVSQGHKPLENRTWWFNYRGPFLIHSSSKCTKRQYAEVVEVTKRHAPDVTLPELEELVLGSIVGRAVFTDVVLPRAAAPTTRWHFPDRLGYVLEGCEPLEPFAISGHQGLWNLSESQVPARLRKSYFHGAERKAA